MPKPFSPQKHSVAIALSLLMLTLLTVVRSRSISGYDQYGYDLMPTYYGCKVLASGEGDQLFARDRATNLTVSSAWDRQFANGTRAYKGPAYIQTPLWAWSLRPVCTRLGWYPFRFIFLLFLCLCTSLCLYFVARYWAPHLFSIPWIILCGLALYITEPYRYSIALVQTHIIFVLLTIVSIILALREKEVPAGILLALAAMVKISPGLLVIYWLFTRRYRAAASFFVTMILLFGMTVLAVGPYLTATFLHELNQFTSSIFLAYNNQSLAAWWMGRGMPNTYLFDWALHYLPPWLKALSLLFAIAAAAVGGYMDRDRVNRYGTVPYGAIFAMLGITVFSVVCWSHYAIILIFPLMLLVDRFLAHRSRESSIWLAAAAAIYLLTVRPFVVHSSANAAYYWHGIQLTIIRGIFYSMLLAMASVAALRYTERLQHGD